jgi:hypothetical protein
MNFRATLTCLLALLFALPAAAAPTKLAQQGRVLDGDGAPLEGSHHMVFVLYDADTDGTALWTEERSADFAAGYYSIMLGEQVPLDDLLFTAESVWLELSIDGETLVPRQEVVSVPYALRATTAEHVEGGVVDAAEISVDGTVVIDASGNWVGPTPAVGWGDLADIPADIVDGDQDEDTLAGLACAEGQLPKWDAASSLWVCGDDIDTDTTDPNTDMLVSLACSTGQVAKWDGATWVCGNDIDTDTTDPNTDTLLGLPCADGYIAKFDGVAGLWDCALDVDSFADLAGVCLPDDIPVLDAASGGWVCGTDTDTVTSSLPWSAITGVPADLADGDQDTQLTTVPWSMLTGIPEHVEITEHTWTNLALNSKWEPYPGDFEDPGVSVRNGVVRLRGLAKVKHGGGWTWVNSGYTHLGTLPEGYRPLKTRIFSVTSYQAGNGTTMARRLNVYANGNIEVYIAVQSFSPTWVSLDGVQFTAD